MSQTHVQRIPVRIEYFNPQALLPYGLLRDQIKATIEDAHEFVYNLNSMLYQQIGQRIEDILMAATFSGMLSELIVRQLSKHSTTLTRNLYHNDHPDLIPLNYWTLSEIAIQVRGTSEMSGFRAGKRATHLISEGVYYSGNAVQYGHEGVEVKTSRYGSGWQGHNPEKIWIMVFRYHNDPHKPENDRRPLEKRAPFQIAEVLAAQLDKSDWSAQGRRAGSRRTPTASIVASGTAKLRANWVYRVPDFGV
jgi:hypothetical protein